MTAGLRGCIEHPCNEAGNHERGERRRRAAAAAASERRRRDGGGALRR
ncbi:hypothetical protein HMPREF0731_2926, partial [Pseudoroseomonas cervicalis ATCC 49957]